METLGQNNIKSTRVNWHRDDVLMYVSPKKRCIDVGMVGTSAF